MNPTLNDINLMDIKEPEKFSAKLTEGQPWEYVDLKTEIVTIYELNDGSVLEF